MRAMIAAALRRLAHKLEPGPVVVTIDGEEIVRAIKTRNRRKGLGSAGI